MPRNRATTPSGEARHNSRASDHTKDVSRTSTCEPLCKPIDNTCGTHVHMIFQKVIDPVLFFVRDFLLFFCSLCVRVFCTYFVFCVYFRARQRGRYCTTPAPSQHKSCSEAVLSGEHVCKAGNVTTTRSRRSSPREAEHRSKSGR